MGERFWCAPRTRADWTGWDAGGTGEKGGRMGA